MGQACLDAIGCQLFADWKSINMVKSKKLVGV